MPGSGQFGVDVNQVGAEDVFRRALRRQPGMRIHPRRRKHQQPALSGLNLEADLDEISLAAARDIIEVDEKREHAMHRVSAADVDMRCFLLLRRRQLALTLFPYTTLFR